MLQEYNQGSVLALDLDKVEMDSPSSNNPRRQNSISSLKYSYYDSRVLKTQNQSEMGSYLPRKSTVNHIKLADDKFNTKMADDLYYDVDFNPQIKKDKQSYQDLLSSTVSQSEVKEYKSKIRPPSIS